MITTTERFHKLARQQVVGIRPTFQMSFEKEKRSDVEFFTLGKSALDGVDILGANGDNPIQLWDTYSYKDYTDRLTKIEYSRSIEFPNNVQTALADATLENHDGYFNPADETSQIAKDNLPQRPVRINMSYDGASENLGQFVGLTQGMPTIDAKGGQVKYHAMDFLSAIAEQKLTKIVNMRDTTTDKVLAAIVEQFGVLPSQYSFEKGANNIPFVFFDIEESAGDAIKKLMQAEGGKFWLDEQGILRFTSRTHMTGDAQYSFANHQLLSIQPSGDSGIVNHVIIKCDVREVQEFQTIYTKDSSGDSTGTNLWVIPPMGEYTISVSLDDPCASIELPTQGLNSYVSWFTTKRSSGAIVNTGITATATLHESSYEVTFKSTLNYAVEVDEMSLWGEPAKIIDQINYDAYDSESVEKYGEQLLQITDNEFFQDYGQVRSFGLWVLREYANYNPKITMSVRGDFSLQLGDVISIDYGEYAGIYQIDSMSYSIGRGSFTNQITAHKHQPVAYFTLNESILNGTDVLA